MLSNSPNIFWMTPHFVFIQRWNLLLRALSWQSSTHGGHHRALIGPAGPGSGVCNYKTEWAVGSYSFITYYSVMWVMSVKINITHCTGLSNWLQMVRPKWGGGKGEMFSYLVLISSPALHKQVPVECVELQLTIHSELINIWAVALADCPCICWAVRLEQTLGRQVSSDTALYSDWLAGGSW